MSEVEMLEKRVDTTSTKYFNKNGKLHNPVGPAVIWSDGDTEWWINGKTHREDGPSINWVSMQRFVYYRHGKAHRYDGPAEIELYENGDLEISRWLINGKKIDEDKYIDWLSEMKMDILNLTDDDKTIIDLYWA